MKKKDKNKESRNPYVQYETIFKSVGGALNTPGERAVRSVGKHKVLVERHKDNKNGEMIHSVSLIRKDGTLAKPVKRKGSATFTTSEMLRENGIAVKFKRRFPKKSSQSNIEKTNKKAKGQI